MAGGGGGGGGGESWNGMWHWERGAKKQASLVLKIEEGGSVLREGGVL